MQRGRSRFNNNGDYSRGGNFQRNSNYGERQQSAQSPWQPDAPRSNEQLNELNLQLEMVKRKRQMLQEQRQLLEEQQQLDRIQSQRNASPWEVQPNRQPYSQPQQGYNQYSNYQNRYYSGEQRGFKRPANQSPWKGQSQPKRFAAAPAPRAFAPNRGHATKPGGAGVRPSQQRASSQLDREIGPVGAPPGVYRGQESLSNNSKSKINTAVSAILREMKELYFCPPHNIAMANFQYNAMRKKVTERMLNLMKNKPVMSTIAMQKIYRGTHTPKGDLRLIEAILKLTEPDHNLSVLNKALAATKSTDHPLAKKAMKGKSTVAKETIAKENTARETDELKDAAQAYLKEHFNQALDGKLTDIFEKVHKIYAEEATEKMAVDGDEADQPEVKKADESETKANSDEPETKPNADKPDTKVDTESSAEIKDASKTDSDVAPTGIQKKELTKPEFEVFEALVDTMLRRKLPQLLPQYKGFILSNILRDPAFVKFDLQPEVKPAEGQPLKFVKIFGRPTLPPRATMQQFLQQFTPGSIKKHKSIHNLLFVGVPVGKFESLLEHSGQTVGNKLLDIVAVHQDTKHKKEQVSEREKNSNDQKEVTNGAVGAEDNKSKDINNDVDANIAVNPVEASGQTSLNGDSEMETMKVDEDMESEIDELLTSMKESDNTDNVDATAEDDEATGENLEDTVDNSDETGDSAEKSEDNIAETGTHHGEDESKDQETAKTLKTSDSAVETSNQVEKTKNENCEDNVDATAEDDEATGENLEDTVDNSDKTGDSAEKSEDNIAETGTHHEEDESKDQETAKTLKTSDSAVETSNQVEKTKNENCEGKGGNAEEVKAPNTPVSAIQTRRSSRLPQKN